MKHVKYIDVIFKKYQKWIFEIKIAEKYPFDKRLPTSKVYKLK